MSIAKKIMLLLFIFAQVLYAQQILSIATAYKDSSYDVLAQSIKEIVESNTDYKINIVHTHGSVDNIKRLEANKVDLAIVQNDTAFYAQQGYAPFDAPLEQIQMLFAFYDEPIYVVTNQSNINNIVQLKNMRVNVGEKKSGLLESAKVLLKSTEIWESITPFYRDLKKAKQFLAQNKVQVMFLNTLTEDVQARIDDNSWHIVPVPTRIIKKLQKTFSYFNAFNIDENTYTLAVKSILISNNTLEKDIVYTLTKLLYEHQDELVYPNEKSYEKKDCFCSNPLRAWHGGTEQFLGEQHIEPKASQNSWYFLYGVGAVILVFLVFGLLVMYLIHKVSLKKSIHPSDNFILNFLKIFYLKVVDHKYIVFILVVFSLYIASIFAIKYFEHEWALLHNNYSAFDDFSFKESILWLFIFATSSYNGGIFPHSDMGKLFASFIPMIGWGGLLAFATLIASDKIKQFLLEVKGMGSIKDEDHIVLCGWNKNGCNIIEALTHDNIEHKRKVVILADERFKPQIDLCLLNQKYVTHLVGHAKSKEDLERANLKKSNTVVVLQNDTHTDPDAYAILDVLTINKYANDLGIRREKGSEFQIIIQLHSNHNKQIAIDAGADQVISLSSVESNILSNMIQTPGINHFVEEIFDYNDTNDIYSIDAVQGSQLIGKTYNEALVLLRKYNILLLSINIAYHRNEEETQKIKETYGLNRDVITNPINDAENSYTIQEGGMLIVLAQYGKSVSEAVEILNKNRRER